MERSQGRKGRKGQYLEIGVRLDPRSVCVICYTTFMVNVHLEKLQVIVGMQV